MIDGVRLASLLKEKGLSQSELARRVGVKQQTIHKLVTGASRSSAHVASIARELSTSVGYLEGKVDDPSEGASGPPTPREIAEHFDLVAIARIDLAYGMGGSYTDAPVEVQVEHFPRAWVESITRTPAKDLTFALGRGESMEPTLRDGDMVLIDRSQRTVREQDAIWALTWGEIAMIKRVRVRGPQVLLLSDNDRVPSDEVHHDEINIVGRVVFIGRRT